MDAYVFAHNASGNAVTILSEGVGEGGPARVVCPLTSGSALYVAVEGSSVTLPERVAEVTGTSGIANPDVYTVTDDDHFGGVSFPTHALVGTYIGFALLDSANPAATAALAAEVSGVIGVAVVTDGSDDYVLVEVTGSSGGSLTTAFAALDAITGVTLSFTATGQTSPGTGFPEE